MKQIQSLFCVDAHTTGTPIRVITGGIPPLHGNTIHDKMLYMEKHFDWLRALAACPPRAPQSLVCAVLVPPCDQTADYGVFYMDAKSYQPMCGAGTLSVAKVLVETGLVEKKEPVTKIVLETPSGIVTTSVELKDGEVQNVSLENAPAFLYKKDVVLQVPELGDLTIDIGFGGNFFAIVDSSQLPIPLTFQNKEQYQTYMRMVVDACSSQISVCHPENPALNYLNQVLFYKNTPDSNGGFTCQCVFGDAQLDISPCGTGTCARLAQQYTRGNIGLKETFIQNSIWGSSFYAEALKETTVGDLPAILPKISCTDVRITGFNQLIAEEADPYKTGLTHE